MIENYPSHVNVTCKFDFSTDEKRREGTRWKLYSESKYFAGTKLSPYIFVIGNNLSITFLIGQSNDMCNATSGLSRFKNAKINK